MVVQKLIPADVRGKELDAVAVEVFAGAVVDNALDAGVPLRDAQILARHTRPTHLRPP
jgi:hypothetical protein